MHGAPEPSADTLRGVGAWASVVGKAAIMRAIAIAGVLPSAPGKGKGIEATASHKPCGPCITLRLLCCVSMAVAVSGLTTANATANATTLGAWFMYAAQASVFLGSSCGGSALASVSDPQQCTAVTINYDGEPAYVAVQASCSDDGTSVSFTACLNTQSCDPSGNCVARSVSSGTCLDGLLLYGQPASAQFQCNTGNPTPLLLGCAIGGGVLLLVGVAASCWSSHRSKIARQSQSSTTSTVVAMPHVELRTPLMAGGAFCVSCGAANQAKARFCGSCGAAQS